MLTVEYVRTNLHYCPDSGVLKWIIPRQGRTLEKPIGMSQQRYPLIVIEGTPYLVTRLIWLYVTGDFPDNEIDHIDRNPFNNKWSNLRLSTRSENAFNRITDAKYKKSGLPRWVSKCGNKYKATVTFNRKSIHIGVFLTSDEAHIAARRYIENSEKASFIPQTA